MTGSFDWNDQVERGGREIEFSSFPPGFLPFPFSRFVSIFFSFLYRVHDSDKNRFIDRVIIRGLR